MFRVASETSTCLERAPYQSDNVNCPFDVRHGMPVFQYYAHNPAKAARFARAMAALTQGRSNVVSMRFTT